MSCTLVRVPKALAKIKAMAGCTILSSISLLALTTPAWAEETEQALNGAELGILWAIPFLGMLLSIALGPLLVPAFWGKHFGKVALFWALVFLVPFGLSHGWNMVVYQLTETAAFDYFPFVILLGALFTIAGGILITGNLHGSPKVNVALLACGTILASVVGTTGASMVLIRPLIRANDGRKHNTHVIIFFIFLVSNIGGALSPLGDPPLFLGYLRGVSFFWTLQHLAEETAFAAIILLAIFFFVDSKLYHNDLDFKGRYDPTPDSNRIGIQGRRNIILLFVVVATVLVSGMWKPGVMLEVGPVEVGLQDALRDLILVVTAIVSLIITPSGLRTRNGFEWEPILEVAKLFAGIFVTMIPVLAMLRAAQDGTFAPLVSLVSHADGTPVNAAYFWVAGILSSFLDNAPTYLVFFNLAGGDAQHLMGPLAVTLAAISCGAVFMGANSYIGNAPNFMVRSIAESNGIKMPSFFGYLMWSGGILIPLFLVITAVFFIW